MRPFRCTLSNPGHRGLSMRNSSITGTTGAAWLVPLSGPPLEPLALNPAAGDLIIGRQEDCSLRLPIDAEQVSRRHARFRAESGRWFIADAGSRWGTFVNGVQLKAATEVPLAEGDLVRITPWTFAYGTSPVSNSGFRTHDDTQTHHTLMRSLAPEQAQPLAEDTLALLLESAAAIHGAADEKTLADLVMDAACRGTGLPNAAVLRPLDAEGRIEIIATRGEAARSGPAFSRSLLAAASNGNVAEFTQGDDDPLSQSIVQMRVSQAICVPLMLGSCVAAYLYVDARGAATRSTLGRRSSAAAFCLALGRMASLALANLKRLDMERRQALLEAELLAGAEAQRWILPRRTGSHGALSWTGESRPGRYVGGDFFDVIPLSGTRLVVAMGDVTGKGIPASVLMTATQGFLHAAIRAHAGLGRALTDLNRFVIPRRPEGKFVTLWLGLFDLTPGTPGSNTLTFVDAGHGYAGLCCGSHDFRSLAGSDGLPIGVLDDTVYVAETTSLAPGQRVVVVSDGIIEQPGNTGEGPARTKQQFGLERLRATMLNASAGAAKGDDVATIFEAVTTHAGGAPLADDATALVVRW
jgi:serine phosphatase RsbU (regulator of sigma subunit)